jgi:hypothetical protein
VRIGVGLYLGDVVDAPPLMTDQRSYHALGVRLLQGHGYSFDRDWYPFTPADMPTAHWSFLYPLFVAAVYALFGVHPLAARLAQAILGGALLPWMVYRLARETAARPSSPPPGLTATPLSHPMEEEEGGRGGGGEGLPLLAAAITAVYGYFVLYAATLMTETFYIGTLLWSLTVGLSVGKRLRDGCSVTLSLALQLGLGLGLAALLRQSVLPWTAILSLWLLWQARAGKRWRPVVGTLAVTGLVVLACILPWTVRNYRVYGQFLLLNSNAGYAMYSAQHPMHGTSFREFEAAPLPAGGWGRPEAELDRDLMRLGVQFVVEDPLRYVLLSLSRVRAFFEFWPTPDTSLLHNLGRSGSFGLLLPFMIYGLYLVIRNSQLAADNSLLLLFAGFYSLLHILTWAMVRYRLPVDGVLIPFAALALLDLYRRGRRWLSDRRPVGLALHSDHAGGQPGEGV